jgi:hypothetical protein
LHLAVTIYGIREQLICHILSAVYYCRHCLLKVHVESSSLLLLPSLVRELACRLLLQALFTKSSYGDSSFLLFPSPVEWHACWLLLQASFTKCSHGEQLLVLPHFSGALRAPAPSAICPFQFLVNYSGFFFCGAGVTLSRGLCWFIQGWLWEYQVPLICSSVCLPLPSGFGSVGTLQVSQCNIAWRSFVQARGLGCQSFAFSWCFFSAKCGSSISVRFLIFGAHIVCFLPPFAILDPLMKTFKECWY